MRFKIRALTPDQQIIEEIIEARTEAEARLVIKSRGWVISSLQQIGALSLLKAGHSGLKPAKFSLLLFSQELLALLNAGLTIVEALEALLEKEQNQEIRSVLSGILTGLQEGKRFSQVLAEQEEYFPDLFVGIVQASESASTLPPSLARFIEYQQRIDVVRNKIISSLIYPAILFLVGGAVTFFLLVYVVPRFAEVYRGTGRALPWSSQLLLNWGTFVTEHASVFTLVCLAGVLFSGIFIKGIWQRNGALGLIAKFPGFNESIRIYSLSRLYMTLGMLLDGGIPIVAALNTAANMAGGNMQTALLQATASIESGVMLSEAFESYELTTPISQRLLRVGERTGELGKMLTQSANFYEGEITRWIDRFIRSFEPILMAVIGLIVGTIVVLLYMPIFDLADGLS
ncbi:type II secretion system F family protein [Undibacterium sp. Tian12W]|uniref:type II secretion system F family protein n=1 Tax=Undibacterium sp. Tian12W TaxID=3413054 RepID=UPI003BEF79B7